MFQCIIQPRNGWIRNSPELKDVFPDIRAQLGEQLRCLDVRMENQVALVAELQDFFRKRAEVELDYSKGLDKLAKSLSLRHKEQRQRREQWPLFSSYTCWQQLLSQTRSLSRDHAALSELYSTHLVSRLGQVTEDVQRIYRRCREIGSETHEELLRVLHELHTTMKTYQAYLGEARQAESKLRQAEAQRTKLEQTLAKDKLERSKKYRLIEKEVSKRTSKHQDARLKALKARNEYILCLEASNTTIHKYFADDLSDLIDCMDLGFHTCVSRALLLHVSAEEGCVRAHQAALDSLTSCVNGLDSRLDKQRFLEASHHAFMVPKKFEFQGIRDEQPCDGELQKQLRAELETRLGQLSARITSLRIESEEVWKTLETAETTLLAMLTAKDVDCSGYFGEHAATTLAATRPPETASLKLRADRHETEEFYLSKFREYLLGTSRIARLEAKHEHLRAVVLPAAGGGGADSPTPGGGLGTPGSQQKAPRRKRIGRLHQISGQPKLFGGSLEEYLEIMNQEIPLIIKSCIRVINLYGLHHQGIFRVSGSQVEINNFRESFERGEDPLADMTDASDINSVAGVLKLYLRELREPLFPIIYFDHFMELAQLEYKHDFVTRMRELVQSLPRPVVIVMRYLFAFLNHLSEYSDENMMDPYNLAICFGPTLVPVPEDKDQVQYQNQVNELIKNIILFNEDIFPIDGGCLYEKYISREPDDTDVGDAPPDQSQDDIDSEIYPSEDESESLEATAQFDFIARSDRELGLKKGDQVQLYLQVSNDWWRGAVNGREGLIPDKYILLKIKDEERDKLELIKSSSSSSEESVMKRRVSSSNGSTNSSSGVGGSASGGSASPVGQQPTPIVQAPQIIATASPLGVSVVNNVVEQEIDVTTTTTTTLVDNSVPPAVPPSATDNSSAIQAALNTANNLALAALRTESTTVNNVSSAPIPIPTPKKPPSAAHIKSHSLGGNVESNASNTTESVSFSAVSELWHRRAASQGDGIVLPATRTERADPPSWAKPPHAPDLVMDLPLDQDANSVASSSSASSSSSGDEAGGPDSPDMSTAAERFAKQNQCTLKKNTKHHSSGGGTGSGAAKGAIDTLTPPSTTATAKPQLKAKPAILKKPVLPAQLVGVTVQPPQAAAAPAPGPGNAAAPAQETDQKGQSE